MAGSRLFSVCMTLSVPSSWMWLVLGDRTRGVADTLGATLPNVDSDGVTGLMTCGISAGPGA